MFQSTYFREVGNVANPGLPYLFEDFSPDKEAAALDLGAGNLRNADYCLQYGFKEVVAVDDEPQCQQFAKPGITFCIEPIQQHQIPTDRYSLVLGCNTLFFLPPEDLESLFPRIFEGLKRGGIFFFNLLGEDDDWVNFNAHPAGVQVYSSSQALIDKLFLGFRVELKEEYFNRDKRGLCLHENSFVLRKP